VAVAGERRAEADEVAIAQLVERAQQMVLICEPAFVLCDDGSPIAVGANPERISPFAAAADIDGFDWDASYSLSESEVLTVSRNGGRRR
jgi:hypothetical protein